MKLILLQGNKADLQAAAVMFKHAANFAKWGREAIETLRKPEAKP